MTVCRVPGCIALAAGGGRYRLGLCLGHRQLTYDQLRILLARAEPRWLAPLKRLGVGIEYERPDGSQCGIDHAGNYYDVKGAR